MSDINNENLTPETEEDNLVVLTDEEGNDVSFELLDVVEYNDADYAVLLPIEEDDEEGGIVILKILTGEEEDVEVLEPAGEEEATAVFEIFKEEFKDEFNFVD